ncbi:MAG: hypothetical protein IKE53_05350 [Clostridiales bacterium]|nr:hypothetical protein [Clostridiales bacterium]
MILSYEQAFLRRKYIIERLEGLPQGREVTIKGKYKAFYVSDHPGHPELKFKRISLAKPEARAIRDLAEQRIRLEIELRDLENFLKTPVPRREVKPDPYVELEFYDLLKARGIYSKRKKPKFSPSFAGFTYRSKSELAIAQLINSMNYDFLYEPMFPIRKDKEIFPDFVVAVPEIGRCFILEHFGMWDDREYRGDAQWKMEEYIDYGFMPGRDIIFTYETGKVPLDIDVVREQINALILANSAFII